MTTREQQEEVIWASDPVSNAVVGVDGSDNSLAALAWAAAVVGTTGTLHVVTVGEPGARRPALEKAWAEPLRNTGLTIQLHMADRDPAEVVTEFADATGADLIVLGVHSGPAHLPHAVGSVAHKTLRRAHCPVAIVRDPSNVSDLNGPVVVGVGSESSTEAATDFAATLADGHSGTVELVRVVNFHPFLGMNDAADVLASYVEPKQLIRWAEEELELVAGHLENSGLVIRRRVASGDVGGALVKQTKGAAALVVGKHFDGKITGYFTGRTIHHVLTHSSCPVVVVPGSATG